MSELLTQQLSSVGGESGGLDDQVGELRSEVGRLESVVRGVSGERDQALGDLDALREAMLQQRQESAERVRERERERDAYTRNLVQQCVISTCSTVLILDMFSSRHSWLVCT